MTDPPTARAARQLLESLERSGVTHLARPSEPQHPVPKAPEGDDGQGTPSGTGESAGGLEVLCDEVAACRLCGELAETRTQTVFGVGDPEAKILFVVCDILYHHDPQGGYM